MGRGYKNVFYACIGTGIGTGILFDGRIYYGRTGAAAEGGHVSIDYNGPRCGCSKKGCIEVLASGTAIGKKVRTRLAEGAGRKSVMMELQAVAHPFVYGAGSFGAAIQKF